MALPPRPNMADEIPNGPFGQRAPENEAQEKESPSESKKKKVRARTEDGHFVKDDPATPENEAWVEAEEALVSEPEVETETAKD